MGYIIETKDSYRRNPIMNSTMVEVVKSQLGLKTTFGYKPATTNTTVLIKKDRMSVKLKMGTKELFSVVDLVIWKNDWIQDYCWVDGIATVAEQQVGYNFAYTVDYDSVKGELDDILAMCYPAFIIRANDGFESSFIITRQSEIIPKGKFEFIVDQNYVNETLKIEVLMKSDTYFFKQEKDYSDFQYTLIGNVSVEGGQDVPFYQ